MFSIGPARFEAERAMRTIVALADTIGPREDADARYGRAADLIAAAFSTLGYDVARQRIPVPAGNSERVPVPSGVTQNIVATPKGFDPKAPHLLVGGHLDTVAVSPGANDNASGIAVIMELARLARIVPTAMPIVWVAFGGEERRRPGFEGTTYGSRHYLKTRGSGLRGVLALDVVGHGATVLICSGGKTRRPILNALRDSARKQGIGARERVVTKFFSDHTPFERAGITVGWLWSGEYPQVHKSSDVPAIIQPDALRRAGLVAWEALKTLRL